MNILIVDDVSENIAVLESLLSGAGYSVTPAKNGEDALALVRKGSFDMIISDILMPVMDGFQLCRECKTDPALKTIPFMFYTATYTEKKDQEFALALGADRFLVKPEDPVVFLRVVVEVFESLAKKSAAEKPQLDREAYLAGHNERVIQKLEKKAFDLSRVNHALKESEEKYRLVVDNASEAIMIVQKGAVLFANPESSVLFGWRNEDLIAHPFIDFIHPDYREVVREDHLIKSDGEPVSTVHPVQIQTGDGKSKWVEIHAVLISWKEKPAILTFLRDITDRMHSQEALQQSFHELRKALDGTVQAVALVVEARDPYTAGHQKRVANLAVMIARAMGLSEDVIYAIRMAGSIHDIGKISIPAEILSKPGRLSDIEMKLIRIHPEAGYEILKDTGLPFPIAEIALEHHERMDGSGYPRGLKGNEMILEARIVAVADVVEAISSHRPYRPALGINTALEELVRNRGILYDSEVVDKCFTMISEKGFDFS